VPGPGRKGPATGIGPARSLRVHGGPAPVEVFAGVADRPFSLWLDSSLVRDGTGRHSFIAIDPYAVLVASAGRAVWIDGTGARPLEGGGLAALERALAEAGPDGGDPTGARLPFPGGAAGYVGYEVGAEIERLPPPRARDLGSADLELAFYDLVLGWDHVDGAFWIVSTGLPERGEAGLRRAGRRLEAARAWLAGEAGPPAEHPLPRLAAAVRLAAPAPDCGGVRLRAVPGTDGLVSTFDRDGYETAVREGVERIRAGDIFQVNLSQRFSTRGAADAFETYRDLRARAPAPFGAFFRGATCTVASASPERFLRVTDGGRVEARPIKGTRPRGRTPGEDDALARALLASDKDRAENLMIADLLRNDLSRVCLPGSVRAAGLFRLESFATVHHLVSVVEGRMRRDRGPVDLLRAAFPCGSVTGAPKPRAMEIIAGLEPTARGPSYGAIGWFGLDGTLDLGVAIRTVVFAGDRAAFHAGGAVVADSDPALEYRETLDKARALAASLGHEI
jgi:para-aminobenzoate synthetase component I